MTAQIGTKLKQIINDTYKAEYVDFERSLYRALDQFTATITVIDVEIANPNVLVPSNGDAYYVGAGAVNPWTDNTIQVWREGATTGTNNSPVIPYWESYDVIEGWMIYSETQAIYYQVKPDLSLEWLNNFKTATDTSLRALVGLICADSFQSNLNGFQANSAVNANNITMYFQDEDIGQGITEYGVLRTTSLKLALLTTNDRGILINDNIMNLVGLAEFRTGITCQSYFESAMNLVGGNNFNVGVNSNILMKNGEISFDANATGSLGIEPVGKGNIDTLVLQATRFRLSANGSVLDFFTSGVIDLSSCTNFNFGVADIQGSSANKIFGFEQLDVGYITIDPTDIRGNVRSSPLFVPTTSSPVNCTVNSIAPSFFVRVGNIVEVYGQANVTATVGGIVSFITDDPVATTSADCVGSANTTAFDGGFVSDSGTGTKISANIPLGGTETIFYNYSYLVV
jgi:hypothetical protein